MIFGLCELIWRDERVRQQMVRKRLVEKDAEIDVASAKRWLVGMIKELCVNFARHGFIVNVRRFQTTHTKC